MTDDQINKTCFSIVTGRKGVFINSDYLNNPADYLSFLHFCVNEWEGWEGFLADYWDAFIDTHSRCIHPDLLKDQRALPMALALYQKEKEKNV